MNVSVCIPTIRPDTLADTIRSIRNQTIDDWELVVVGQGPAEAALRSTTEQAAEGDSRIKYVHLDRMGASAARNGGIDATTGDVIAFIDDDCEADPSWLAELSSRFTPDVGLVCGAVTAPPPKRRLQRCPEILPSEATFSGAGDVASPPAGFGILGANMAIRRAVASRIGGFDEHLGPGSPFGGAEEHDYAERMRRVGMSLRSSPKPVVHHTHGTRYGVRAVRQYMRDRIRGDGAVAAKWTMVKTGGTIPPATMVRRAALEQLRALRPSLRFPISAMRAAYYISSFRECAQQYTISDSAIGDPPTAILVRR